MTLQATSIEIVGALVFAIAVMNTFLIKVFQNYHYYLQQRWGPNPKWWQDSIIRTVHFFSEPEIVIGFWAGVLVVILMLTNGKGAVTSFFNGKLPFQHGHAPHFTEPLFVFAIMIVASTRPIIYLSNLAIDKLSRLIPINNNLSFYCVALILGPLLGSFITEPAAMTVTALILMKRFYERQISIPLRYATLGLLFVNISVGGTLTHFAAPPVVMVAAKWGWHEASGGMFMLLNFGWKAATAIIISTVAIAFFFRKELKALPDYNKSGEIEGRNVPVVLTIIHILFLVALVAFAHEWPVVLGALMFFAGMYDVTKKYQDPLKFREALLVGFFLSGLVTMGSFQTFWLQPTISGLPDFGLFAGATGLTAVTDNAALTYLGSLVEGISDSAKYALVAGAVTGGGLTFIANAPNPAGVSILKDGFPEGSISPFGLLLWALGPTAVAFACFWFLPSL
ncbi:MAG: putative Na+/H+ antiporter [Candidatus Peregrinibacteria bacterium]